jgi:hypothetical protein
MQRQGGGGPQDPSCGCDMRLGWESSFGDVKQQGGGCGCKLWKGGKTRKQRRGYRATRKNRAALKKWRQGKSIGFTMTASLKAKGLIPRTSRRHYGKKVLGPKYSRK